jgi:acyl-CoA thioesterase FadM
MRFTEAARLTAIGRYFHEARNLVSAASTLFIVNAEASMCSGYHALSSATSPHPVQAVVSLVHVGRTSLVWQTALASGITGKPLVTGRNTVVHVDRRTRRPKMFPDAFILKYGHLHKQAPQAAIPNGNTSISPPAALPSNHQTILSSFPSRHRENKDTGSEKKKSIPTAPPSGSFCHTALMAYSDTDRNAHVNQAVYLRVCMDCATGASLAGHYRHFTHDMCSYAVRELVMHYLGESVANDTLTVRTWQDGLHDGRIFFSVYKNNAQIFYAKIEFSLVATHAAKL